MNATIKNMTVTLALIVSAGAIAGGGYEKKEKKTIAEVAIANGSFETLVAALSCTDLVGAVSDPKAQLTVFAPTDEAFKKANLDKNNICTTYSKDVLKNILLYHVAGKKLASPAVVNGMAKEIEMLNGGVIKPEGKGSLVLFANSSKANIAIADVKASNGIIHAVDGVLLP